MLTALLTGCATNNESRPEPPPPGPSIEQTSAEPFLLELRDYLGSAAGEQAAYREHSRRTAEGGDPSGRLKYALALSVDRDDRGSLELARKHFQALLSAPDPLPVALDTLVRLQLGQVMDRLERMERTDAILHAGRATAAALDTCRVQLRNRDDELAELREKLNALTRIEQTVESATDSTGNESASNDQEEMNNARR